MRKGDQPVGRQPHRGFLFHFPDGRHSVFQLFCDCQIRKARGSTVAIAERVRFRCVVFVHATAGKDVSARHEGDLVVPPDEKDLERIRRRAA